ncbi:hypothetical protein HY086_05155 [Candidatus Gottesmanbacteria bacterium]|nr:hypothetical protein [Candidatus Gottesmanbacteria bacterium]
MKRNRLLLLSSLPPIVYLMWFKDAYHATTLVITLFVYAVVWFLFFRKTHKKRAMTTVQVDPALAGASDLGASDLTVVPAITTATKTKGTRGLRRLIMHSVVITILTIIASVGLQFTPVWDFFQDREVQNLQIALQTLEDAQQYILATDKIEAQLPLVRIRPLTENESALAKRGYDDLIKASEKMSDSQRLTTLVRAQQWVDKFGMEEKKTEIALRVVAAQPKPTPIPTQTVAPTSTPRVFVRGESNPCQPPAGAADEAIPLAKAMNGFTANLSSDKVFWRNLVPVNVKGNELAICIAASQDGTKAPVIDDVAIFTVEGGDSFSMPGYNNRTGGIKEWPPQDISWLFPKPGNYTMSVILRDELPKVWSTTDLWLLIWRRR